MDEVDDGDGDVRVWLLVGRSVVAGLEALAQTRGCTISWEGSAVDGADSLHDGCGGREHHRCCYDFQITRPCCDQQPHASLVVQGQQMSTVPVRHILRDVADSVAQLHTPTTSKDITSVWHIRVQTRRWTVQPDLQWSRRLMALLADRQRHFHMMNWFSTIGGGYSQLAQQQRNERTLYRAHQAGKYALKMMKVAHQIGDKETMARCALYYALALAQQGHYRGGQFVLQMCRRWSRAHNVKLRQGKLSSVYLQVRATVKGET